MSGSNNHRRPVHSKSNALRPIDEQTLPMRAVRTSDKKTANKVKRRGLLRYYDAMLNYIDRRVDHDGSKPSAIFKPRTSPPGFVLSVMVTSFRLIMVIVLIICFIACGSLFGIARAYINAAPNLNLNVLTDTALASQIYDQNGELITTYSGVQNRLWTPYNELPKNLVNAIVAIEDSRFFTHNGVDIKRIAGSLISNLTSDANTQGASTITQQLIKNRMLTSERSYKRKIQEAYLAFELEKTYTKQQILEAYLNDVNLNQGNYGVKSAARDYFGKELNQLTLRECAMLAGMVQSPNTYDPRRNYYTRNRPDLTDNRTDTVLSRMYRQGYITSDQYTQALAEKVHINPERTNSALSAAPSFVDYVIHDVIDHFLTARNLPDTTENRNAIDYELRTKGYSIYTTLDMDVQSSAETAVYNYKGYPKMKNPNDATTSDANADGSVTELTQPQAGVVVIDYHSGQIKAMVGGRTEPTGLKVLNRAYMSHQPVGSSIKPLSVYGPAIDSAGLGAGSIIANLKGPVNGWNTAKGFPSQGSIDGPVTMRMAIQESLNLSAARTLMELSGSNSLQVSVSYLTKLGINMDAKYMKITPAGLALGTNGISPLDEAVAYAAIANKGQYITPISFTKVEDTSHKIILDAVGMQKTTQVFKPGTAWLLVDMLTNAVQNGTGTKAKVNGVTIAGKTGTNDDYTGVTFAGITPHYTCAIYIGSDKYKPLQTGASGGTFAAPLFSNIMTSVYTKKHLQNGPIIPDSPTSLGLVQATVCPVSGMLATDACSQDEGGLKPVTDWFPADSVPQEPCTYHVLADYCADSGKLATPYCTNVVEKAYVLIPPDSVYAKVDLAKFPWFHISDHVLTYQTDPSYYCPIHSASTSNALRQQAVQNANAALSRAASEIQPYLSRLPGDKATAFTAAVQSLKDLINSQTSLTSSIVSSTNDLVAMINKLKSDYAL